MSHRCFVSFVQFNAQVLCYTKQKMLAEFQEVFFLELFNFICALNLICIATRLDSEAVKYVPIAKYSESGAILLILFIAKFAVVVLEVRGEIVEDHGEALDDSVIVSVFIHGSVAKDRVLGRVCMDVEEHFEHVIALRHHLLQVATN